MKTATVRSSHWRVDKTDSARGKSRCESRCDRVCLYRHDDASKYQKAQRVEENVSSDVFRPLPRTLHRVAKTPQQPRPPPPPQSRTVFALTDRPAGDPTRPYTVLGLGGRQPKNRPRDKRSRNSATSSSCYTHIPPTRPIHLRPLPTTFRYTASPRERVRGACTRIRAPDVMFTTRSHVVAEGLSVFITTDTCLYGGERRGVYCCYKSRFLSY